MPYSLFKITCAGLCSANKTCEGFQFHKNGSCSLGKLIVNENGTFTGLLDVEIDLSTPAPTPTPPSGSSSTLPSDSGTTLICVPPCGDVCSLVNDYKCLNYYENWLDNGKIFYLNIQEVLNDME